VPSSFLDPSASDLAAPSWTTASPFDSGSSDPQIAEDQRGAARVLAEEVCDKGLDEIRQLGTALMRAVDDHEATAKALEESDRAFNAAVDEFVNRLRNVAANGDVTPRVVFDRWAAGPKVDGVTIRHSHIERHVAAIDRPLIPSLDDALKRLADARVEVPTE